MNNARLAVLVLALSSLPAAPAVGEPSLLAYPRENVVFHYDPSLYRLVYPGESLYNPDYDRSGAVLWDRENNRIAYEIYQAPGLQGFIPAGGGQRGFFCNRNRIRLVVDGFSEIPTQVGAIYVRFFPVPYQSTARVFVNGDELQGFYYFIPNIQAVTPTANGFYTGTVDLEVVWSGAQMLRITAFSDKDGNRAFRDEARYDVYLRDQTIPSETRSWGRIKAIYQ